MEHSIFLQKMKEHLFSSGRWRAGLALVVLFVAVPGIILAVRQSGKSVAPASVLAGLQGLENNSVLVAQSLEGFQESSFVSGLASPTAMEFAPDGRLFVTEQGGNLRIVTSNGQLLAAPFFTASVRSDGERGLLGVTFDPYFETNNYVYIYYTANSPNIHNRLSRLTANGNVAVAGSEVVLLDLPSTSSVNHQGGAIHFGADGKLYVAVGDHQNSGNAQQLTNPFGKLLRVNSDGTIPSDNPFFSQTTGINRSIYALGLRNPFTFAVDPVTNKIFINDVGQSTWEEVNMLFSGANYGWPTCEGPQGTGVGSCNNTSFTYPLHAYEHDNNGSGAVTGAVFYRASQFPVEYRGAYFFGDYTLNWLKYLAPSNQISGVNNPATDFRSANLPVDIRVGPDGAMYYADIGSGVISKIEYSSGNLNPQAVLSVSVTTGSAPLFVNFDASGSSDPDGDPLTYTWNFGDGSATEVGVTTSHTYATQGSFTVTLTADDGRGGAGTATQNITVGTPPVANIINPPDGLFYNAGDTINYSGEATDVEDGSLQAGSFSWAVVFHHNDHTHPFLGPVTGATSGSFQIPQLGETSYDVWYRIHLTVTDSSGLSHEVTRDVMPNLVTLTLNSPQSGVNLSLDGQPTTAPIVVQSVVGLTRSIGAPSPQTVGQNTYYFQSWSDGGLSTHNITTPSVNTTYAADFQVVPTGPVTSGWYYPGTQAADTSGGGDRNGFEGSSANLLTDNGLYATDINSGTNNNTSCTNAGKDRHLTRDFSLALPAGKTTVTGLEVKLDGFADSVSNAPKFCVRLSWNGGTSWTAAKTTPTLSTIEQSYVLGTSTDKWGRSSWTTSQLSNGNFRVRIISVASSTARDFSLDSVAIRVTAQ